VDSTIIMMVMGCAMKVQERVLIMEIRSDAVAGVPS